MIISPLSAPKAQLSRPHFSGATFTEVDPPLPLEPENESAEPSFGQPKPSLFQRGLRALGSVAATVVFGMLKALALAVNLLVLKPLKLFGANKFLLSTPLIPALELAKVSEKNDAFMGQIINLTSENSLPTGISAPYNLFSHLGQFVSDLSAGKSFRVKSYVEQETVAAKGADLLNGTDEKKAEAAQFFLEEFMQTGVYDAYPEHFKHVPQDTPDDTLMTDILREHIFVERTPEGTQYRSLNSKIVPSEWNEGSHEFSLKDFLPKLNEYKGENAEAFKSILPENLKGNPKLAALLITSAISDNTTRVRMAPSPFTAGNAQEGESSEEELFEKNLSTAYHQVLSGNREDWLKGVEFFAQKVVEPNLAMYMETLYN